MLYPVTPYDVERNDKHYQLSIADIKKVIVVQCNFNSNLIVINSLLSLHVSYISGTPFLNISIVIALYFHTLRMLLAYSTYFMIIIIRYFDQLYRCLRKRRNTILQRSSFKMDQIKKKKKNVTLFHQTDSSNRL